MRRPSSSNGLITVDKEEEDLSACAGRIFYIVDSFVKITLSNQMGVDAQPFGNLSSHAHFFCQNLTQTTRFSCSLEFLRYFRMNMMM